MYNSTTTGGQPPATVTLLVVSDTSRVPVRPKGHKAKADMKHDALALALSETLPKMMTETHGPWPRGMRSDARRKRPPMPPSLT
jgi:hypothetical protein